MLYWCRLAYQEYPKLDNDHINIGGCGRSVPAAGMLVGKRSLRAPTGPAAPSSTWCPFTLGHMRHTPAETAMAPLGLDRWEQVWDPESDTHCVLGWNTATRHTVIAFRGGVGGSLDSV